MTLAAISMATPLKGTAPLAADVTVRLFAEPTAEVELNCGVNVPAAWLLTSATSVVAACAMFVTAWSRAAAAGEGAAVSAVVA